MKPWVVNKSETILDTKWVSVIKDDVTLPNGIHLNDFYKVRISDCSAIVALDSNENIILKKEYRHCFEQDLIEIPAGCFEDGEESLEVAKRELLEETGYTSDNWIYLGSVVESSAKLTNHMHMYLAQNCVKVSEQHLDESEDIDVMVLPLEKAIEMVMNNEICCVSSASGILKAARLLNK